MGHCRMGEKAMIQTFTGTDERAISQALEALQPYVVIDAQEADPQGIWQESLFASNTVVHNYTAWTPTQRKRFVQANHDGMTVAVVVKKLGGKDPLRAHAVQEYALPTRHNEWVHWSQQQARQYGLTISKTQADHLVSTVGENAWAIHSELTRWAIVQEPLHPMPLTEHAIWAWADALIAGKETARTELASLAELSPFMLIGALGQRLYTQTLYFLKADAETLGINPYTWRIAGQSRQHGWTLDNAQTWLLALAELEVRCKGQGSRLEPWALLAQWQEGLLQAHPSRQ
jgi:DNA polymerase III delta subunit